MTCDAQPALVPTGRTRRVSLTPAGSLTRNGQPIDFRNRSDYSHIGLGRAGECPCYADMHAVLCWSAQLQVRPRRLTHIHVVYTLGE